MGSTIKGIFSASLIGVFLLLCTGVRAQIVNIEDKRKGFDTLGWFGRIDLGANLTRNRNQVVSVNGALRIDQVAEDHRWLILSDYRLVQVSGDNALNAGFAHLRYAYYLSDKWRWESFTQVQYDQQLRIQLRYLLGSGPRLRVYAREKSRAYFGLLYMYEYDEVDDEGSTIFYRDHRLSSYLSFTLFPTEDLQLSNTTYYQPILPDFKRGRFSTVLTASLKVTTRLSVNSQFNLVRDPLLNQGIEDVPTTNYTWTNGLSYTF